MTEASVPDGTLQPHPYALMLPALTADEYRALKEDIRQHGILYPVIVDEDDRVLDGVHRVRIAAELNITPPVSRHEGLTDERKLHLAVGLNMRRRHLDAERRRVLVRKLHTEERLSVRKIADITGWSKSTVDRDLKESPFESILGGMAKAREQVAGLDHEGLREVFDAIVDANSSLFGWADAHWKVSDWPPADDEELWAFVINSLLLRWTTTAVEAQAKNDVDAFDEAQGRCDALSRTSERWTVDPAWRQELLARGRADGITARVRESMSQTGQR